MKLEYKLTFEDFVTAQVLHAKRSEGPYLAHILCYYVYPVIGVLALVFAFTVQRGSEPSRPYTIGAGILLILLPVLARWQWNRLYTRTRSGSGNCIIKFAPELIESESDHTRSELEWDAIQRFAENEKVFLLYRAPARFLVAPKRVCSAEKIEELRALFQAKITPLQKKRL